MKREKVRLAWEIYDELKRKSRSLNQLYSFYKQFRYSKQDILDCLNWLIDRKKIIAEEYYYCPKCRLPHGTVEEVEEDRARWGNNLKKFNYLKCIYCGHTVEMIEKNKVIIYSKKREY